MKNLKENATTVVRMDKVNTTPLADLQLNDDEMITVQGGVSSQSQESVQVRGNGNCRCNQN